MGNTDVDRPVEDTAPVAPPADTSRPWLLTVLVLAAVAVLAGGVLLVRSRIDDRPGSVIRAEEACQAWSATMPGGGPAAHTGWCGDFAAALEHMGSGAGPMMGWPTDDLETACRQQLTGSSVDESSCRDMANWMAAHGHASMMGGRQP